MIDGLLVNYKDPEENQFFSQLQALSMDEPKADILVAQLYRGAWHQIVALILSVNPNLSKTESKIRGAMMVSMLEGSALFMSSEALYNELPASFEKRIKQWVMGLAMQ